MGIRLGKDWQGRTVLKGGGMHFHYAVSQDIKDEQFSALKRGTARFIIYGKPVSSTNSQTVFTNKHTHRAQVSKSSAWKKYREDFLRQVPPMYRNLRLGGPRQPLRATISVYMPDGRGDLETKGIFDLIQQAGVIKNDLYVIEQHAYRHVDKERPRCEVWIEEL